MRVPLALVLILVVAVIAATVWWMAVRREPERVAGTEVAGRTVVVDEGSDISWTMLAPPTLDRLRSRDETGVLREGVLWVVDLGFRTGGRLETVGIAGVTPTTEDLDGNLREVAGPIGARGSCAPEPIVVDGVRGRQCESATTVDGELAYQGHHFVIRVGDRLVVGSVLGLDATPEELQREFDLLVGSVRVPG